MGDENKKSKRGSTAISEKRGLNRENAHEGI